MATPPKDEVGRREFLTGAAAGAAGMLARSDVGLAQETRERNPDHQVVPSDPALRVKALESLLVEKGMVDPATLDAIVDTYETKVGPRNGARVIARAWVDPTFKKRLLTEGTAAIAELGYGGSQGEHMIVLENTSKVHNLVVCTLCSCYPWPVLGLPPTWYKSAPYRSRAVSILVVSFANSVFSFPRTSSPRLGQHGGCAVPRLARARGPDERHHLARRDLQRDVDEHRPVGVGEADVGEADVTGRRPGPQPRATLRRQRQRPTDTDTLTSAPWSAPAMLAITDIGP